MQVRDFKLLQKVTGSSFSNVNIYWFSLSFVIFNGVSLGFGLKNKLFVIGEIVMSFFLLFSRPFHGENNQQMNQ